MSTLTGGCYCGEVRYEITHKPLGMFFCHCRSCQKVSGGAYTPVVIVATKAFKVTKGQTKNHFTENIQGGKHKRGFCADCGSRLTGAEQETPGDYIAVTASSLDDPTVFKPTQHIFVSQRWPIGANRSEGERAFWLTSRIGATWWGRCRRGSRALDGWRNQFNRGMPIPSAGGRCENAGPIGLGVGDFPARMRLAVVVTATQHPGVADRRGATVGEVDRMVDLASRRSTDTAGESACAVARGEPGGQRRRGCVRPSATIDKSPGGRIGDHPPERGMGGRVRQQSHQILATERFWCAAAHLGPGHAVGVKTRERRGVDHDLDLDVEPSGSDSCRLVGIAEPCANEVDEGCCTQLSDRGLGLETMPRQPLRIAGATVADGASSAGIDGGYHPSGGAERKARLDDGHSVVNCVGRDIASASCPLAARSLARWVDGDDRATGARPSLGGSLGDGIGQHPILQSLVCRGIDQTVCLLGDRDRVLESDPSGRELGVRSCQRSIQNSSMVHLANDNSVRPMKCARDLVDNFVDKGDLSLPSIGDVLHQNIAHDTGRPGSANEQRRLQRIPSGPMLLDGHERREGLVGAEFLRVEVTEKCILTTQLRLGMPAISAGRHWCQSDLDRGVATIEHVFDSSRVSVQRQAIPTLLCDQSDTSSVSPRCEVALKVIARHDVDELVVEVAAARDDPVLWVRRAADRALTIVTASMASPDSEPYPRLSVGPRRQRRGPTQHPFRGCAPSRWRRIGGPVRGHWPCAACAAGADKEVHHDASRRPEHSRHGRDGRWRP